MSHQDRAAVGTRLQRLAGMDLLVDSVVLLALPVSLSLMQGSRRDAVMEPRYRRLFWTSNALFAYLRTRRGRCCQPCCELPDPLNSPLISLVRLRFAAVAGGALVAPRAPTAAPRVPRGLYATCRLVQGRARGR